jgi:hypothetical protein
VAKIQLSTTGLEQWIRENTLPLVEAAAEEMVKNIPDNVEVLTKSGVGENGRPFAMVTIAEPKGVAMQAKHGTLTRAAAAAGLDITRYPL